MCCECDCEVGCAASVTVRWGVLCDCEVGCAVSVSVSLAGRPLCLSRVRVL